MYKNLEKWACICLCPFRCLNFHVKNKSIATYHVSMKSLDKDRRHEHIYVVKGLDFLNF